MRERKPEREREREREKERGGGLPPAAVKAFVFRSSDCLWCESAAEVLRARGDGKRKRKREREIGFWRTMASLC